MNLISYLDKKVYIVLLNQFYYVGIVLDADGYTITLRDKNGKRVTLHKDIIASIAELDR